MNWVKFDTDWVNINRFVVLTTDFDEKIGGYAIFGRTFECEGKQDLWILSEYYDTQEQVEEILEKVMSRFK